MIFSRHFLVWRYSKLRYDLELRNVSTLICFTFILTHFIYPDFELRNGRETFLLLFLFFCIETSSCELLGCSDFIRPRDHDLLIRQIIFKYWWLLSGKPFVFKKHFFRFINGKRKGVLGNDRQTKISNIQLNIGLQLHLWIHFFLWLVIRDNCSVYRSKLMQTKWFYLFVFLYWSRF